VVAIVTEVLAAIGSGGTVIGLVAVLVLVFKLVKAKDEQLACRDLLDQEREQHRKTRGELATEVAGHATTQKRLDAEQKLRVEVEAQRNEAFRVARDFYAEKLMNSGVADAIKLVDSVLSGPLPGVVSGGETVPAGDPNRTDDDLLAPDL
jgi:hypothetical protein